MQSFPFAASSDKSHECLIAYSFNTNKYSAPWFDRIAATHNDSADTRQPAEYPGAILGIKSGIPTQALNVLCAVYASPTIFTFFYDEKLFFLQIIKDTDIVGCDEQLRVKWVFSRD